MDEELLLLTERQLIHSLSGSFTGSVKTGLSKNEYKVVLEKLAIEFAPLFIELFELKKNTYTRVQRHEECFDCDQLIDMHRDDRTHCTVCLEDWPCEQADKVDLEQLAKLKEKLNDIEQNTDRDSKVHCFHLKRLIAAYEDAIEKDFRTA